MLQKLMGSIEVETTLVRRKPLIMQKKYAQYGLIVGIIVGVIYFFIGMAGSM